MAWSSSCSFSLLAFSYRSSSSYSFYFSKSISACLFSSWFYIICLMPARCLSISSCFLSAMLLKSCFICDLSNLLKFLLDKSLYFDGSTSPAAVDCLISIGFLQKQHFLSSDDPLTSRIKSTTHFKQLD